MASAFASVYVMFRNILTIVSVLGVIICALMFIIGDPQNDDKVKARIKNILIALIAIWMLVGFVELGKGVGLKLAWDPNNPV